jgi:hypothetical protein
MRLENKEPGCTKRCKTVPQQGVETCSFVRNNSNSRSRNLQDTALACHTMHTECHRVQRLPKLLHPAPCPGCRLAAGTHITAGCAAVSRASSASSGLVAVWTVTTLKQQAAWAARQHRSHMQSLICISKVVKHLPSRTLGTTACLALSAAQQMQYACHICDNKRAVDACFEPHW